MGLFNIYLPFAISLLSHFSKIQLIIVFPKFPAYLSVKVSISPSTTPDGGYNQCREIDYRLGKSKFTQDLEIKMRTLRSFAHLFLQFTLLENSSENIYYFPLAQVAFLYFPTDNFVKNFYKKV